MNAAPATEDEARRIVGICYGADDKRLDASPALEQVTVESPVNSSVADAAPTAFEIKTIPPMSLYYLQSGKPLQELVASLRATVISLYVSLVKSGGAVDGPLQIIVSGDLQGQEDGLTVQLGSPVRGPARGSGRFSVRTTDAFKCASQHFEGERQELRPALVRLAESVRAAQHEFTGEIRIVIPQNNNSGMLNAELQIGIR